MEVVRVLLAVHNGYWKVRRAVLLHRRAWYRHLLWNLLHGYSYVVVCRDGDRSICFCFFNIASLDAGLLEELELVMRMFEKWDEEVMRV
jgi:hypothetical protein